MRSDLLQRIPDERLAEIVERREKATAFERRRGYSHPLERPTWSDIDYLLSLLQPLPAASERELSEDAEDLHLAICEAVAVMNQGDLHRGHDLLRQKLIDFADRKAPLSRSEIVRQQQRSRGSEVTAVMVSRKENSDE